MIKQIHASVQLQSNLNYKNFSSFVPNSKFISITVDFNDMYMHLPPLLIPDGIYCLTCKKLHVHSPYCTSQLRQDSLVFTENGYLRYFNEQVSDDDDYLRDENDRYKYTEETHERITMIFFDKDTYKKKGRGRPKFVKKGLKEHRFSNHIELKYALPHEGFFTSIKLNKNELRFMSLPNDKIMIYKILTDTRLLIEQLHIVDRIDWNDGQVSNVNYQYEHDRSLDLVKIYDYDFSLLLSSKRIKRTSISFLPEFVNDSLSKQKVLLTQITDPRIKGLNIKFTDLNHHLKLSMQIFKSGIIQLFVSPCLKNDVKKRKCEDVKSPSFVFFDMSLQSFGFHPKIQQIVDELISFIISFSHIDKLEQWSREHLIKKFIDPFFPLLSITSSSTSSHSSYNNIIFDRYYSSMKFHTIYLTKMKNKKWKGLSIFGHVYDQFDKPSFIFNESFSGTVLYDVQQQIIIDEKNHLLDDNDLILPLLCRHGNEVGTRTQQLFYFEHQIHKPTWCYFQWSNKVPKIIIRDIIEPLFLKDNLILQCLNSVF